MNRLRGSDCKDLCSNMLNITFDVKANVRSEAALLSQKSLQLQVNTRKPVVST